MMDSRWWTFEPYVYLLGVALVSLLAFRLPAPPFSRRLDNRRYHTMAYARPLPATGPGVDWSKISFGADDSGKIWARDPGGKWLWIFQSQALPQGRTRSFLTRTERSLLVASENGNLYELLRDGHVRASLRVGWRTTGAPTVDGDLIRVPVLDGIGERVKLRLVDHARFHVIAE